MKYGFFSKDVEYIITQPETPRPWKNFSWNKTYLLEIDQTCQGRGQFLPLNSEHRAILLDKRVIYIQDEIGAYNLGYTPICAKPDEFRCSMGLHYTIIEQSMRGIKTSCRFFVPENDPLEIWTLTIRNDSNKQQNLKVFPGVHFRLDSFEITTLPHSFLIDGKFDKETNSIWATNKSYERPNDNFRAFFATNAPVQGYDVVAEAIFDPWKGEREPLFLQNGCTNKDGGILGQTYGFFEHHITLKPNETVVWQYIIGSRFDIQTTKQWINKYMSLGACEVENEFQKKIKNSKNFLLKKTSINTPSEHLNRMANIWCKHQTLFGLDWSGSYIIGFRDILQCLQGSLIMSQDKSKKALFDALSHQKSDGSSIRGWAPLVRTRPSDCHLWITPALTEYIKETGDVEILEQKVNYLDSGHGTVYEHWISSLEFAYQNRGKHGLCLMLDFDWNDSLTIGRKGRGESVWTTQALIYAMKLCVQALNFIGKSDLVHIYNNRIKELTDICNNVAWDGNWYIRAFNDDYEKVGSASNPALGEIFAITQSWAVLAGITDNEKLSKLDRAVNEKLLTKFGYKICHPGFRGEDKMGRLGSANLGVYENASVYCHINLFKVMADYTRGRYDDAWMLAKMMFTDPDFNTVAKNSGAEPYVFTNQFLGPDSCFPGKSITGWITSTASYITQFLLKYMPGVLPDYEGLKILPSLPKEIGSLKMSREFREANYNFDIAIDTILPKNQLLVELNGKQIDSNLIPIQPKGTANFIKVRFNRF
jgi:cellobiose phosphorylase